MPAMASREPKTLPPTAVQSLAARLYLSDKKKQVLSLDKVNVVYLATRVPVGIVSRGPYSRVWPTRDYCGYRRDNYESLYGFARLTAERC